MRADRKLWLGLAALLVVSFSVLLWAGTEIFRAAPPIPERVVAVDGSVVYTRADIEQGRQVWQSIGGMQLGSIWGHGSYVAPDWSADWLHREAVAVLDGWAGRDFGVASYALLNAEQQGALRARLQPLMRTNTFDPQTSTITLPAERVAARLRQIEAANGGVLSEAQRHVLNACERHCAPLALMADQFEPVPQHVWPPGMQAEAKA